MIIRKNAVYSDLKWTLFKRQFKDVKTMMIILGMPIFILLSIWLPSINATGDDAEVIIYMYPAVALLASMMPGMAMASNISGWKENNIATRLKLAVNPYYKIIRAVAQSKLYLGVVQGVFIIFIGSFMVETRMNIVSFIQIISMFVLVSTMFINVGTLIGLFTNNSETAIFIFFMTVMPIFFLGSFPSEMMPVMLQKIIIFIPTDMAIEVMGHMLNGITSLKEMWFELTGLVIYVTISSLLVRIYGR